MYKIAVVGPESTGKSTLSEQLGDYYNSPWIPEYARAYVEQLKERYTYEDVCSIANKQIAYELYYEQHRETPFVFFDTDLIITKVWFEFCFQQVPDFVLQRLETGYFDFYLLCAPDLPWKPDPVREHGHDREYFFEQYKQAIESLNKPYACIEGIGSQRLQKAVAYINQFKHTTQSVLPSMN